MLDSYIDRVEHRRKRFIVYSPGKTEIADRFATRNVTVEHRPLPDHGPPAFVTIRDDGAFLGTIGLEQFETLLTPPVAGVTDRDGIADAYRRC